MRHLKRKCEEIEVIEVASCKVRSKDESELTRRCAGHGSMARQNQMPPPNLRRLMHGALRDVRHGHVLSRYGSDAFVAYFDAAVGLATAFLFVELGWKRIYDLTNPQPLLIAGLCFVHVIVYWVNVHHLLRYSSGEFTILHIWTMSLLSLGLVFYPLSLNAWIDGEENTLYYVVNVWMCALLAALSYQLDVDTDRANYLYQLYHKFAAGIAFLWYALASTLRLNSNLNVDWMLYIAPFLYVCPLGGERVVVVDQDDDDHDDDDDDEETTTTKKREKKQE